MQDMSLAKASLEMFGKIIYLVLFHFCLHLSELVDLQMRVESLKSDKKEKPAQSSRKWHPGSSSSGWQG